MNAVFPSRVKRFEDGGFKQKFEEFANTLGSVIEPIADVTNAILHPKDATYAIMVNDRGETMGITRNSEDIKTALSRMDSRVRYRDVKPRNLASLYIYGNDLNQFEELPESEKKLGVEYDNYLKSIGRNPDDIKTYRGVIPNKVHLPAKTKDALPDYIKSNKNKTYGSRGQVVYDNDDVGGFLQRLSLDSKGTPIVVNSDLWDFHPESYGEKYGSKIKAAALDFIGNPFILKDIHPVEFVDVDEFYNTYYSRDDIEKEVAKDFGFLPPLTVVGHKKKK